jgi:hypothetical protein
MSTYIIDDNHNTIPVNFQEWGVWMTKNDSKRILRKTFVSEDVEISTVFLGLDHNFSGDGNPVLFETMIFGGERDGEMYRYHTYDEAMTDHQAIIKTFSIRCQYCGTIRTGEKTNCPNCGHPF